jgi:hypothetical protein
MEEGFWKELNHWEKELNHQYKTNLKDLNLTLMKHKNN